MSERDGNVLLPIKVVPGASRTKVSLRGDHVKICVTAPAERGKANAAVIETLETCFGAPVTIVSGNSSSQKWVAIPLSLATVEMRLRKQLGG
jgi:uncharacterized protein (TIGR00251 family)